MTTETIDMTTTSIGEQTLTLSRDLSTAIELLKTLKRSTKWRDQEEDGIDNSDLDLIEVIEEKLTDVYDRLESLSFVSDRAGHTLS